MNFNYRNILSFYRFCHNISPYILLYLALEFLRNISFSRAEIQKTLFTFRGHSLDSFLINNITLQVDVFFENIEKYYIFTVGCLAQIIYQGVFVQRRENGFPYEINLSTYLYTFSLIRGRLCLI